MSQNAGNWDAGDLPGRGEYCFTNQVASSLICEAIFIAQLLQPVRRTSAHFAAHHSKICEAIFIAQVILYKYTKFFLITQIFNTKKG